MAQPWESVYVGDTEATAVYVGTDKVWEANTPEPGLLAHFDFNDPGNDETFDRVANRRMALSSFEKVAGYNGQAVSSATNMSLGLVGESLLNRNAYTIAVRQYIPTVTATASGGGVRLYAADGTTIVVQLLARPQVLASTPNLSTISQARFGGTITSASRNSSIDTSGLSAGTWYWLFQIYDGSTLKTFVNNLQWNSVAAPAPPVDAASTSQIYVSGTGALIDDVRFFDYAVDSTKRLAMIAE